MFFKDMSLAVLLVLGLPVAIASSQYPSDESLNAIYSKLEENAYAIARLTEIIKYGCCTGPPPPPHSCDDVLKADPKAPSGEYLITVNSKEQKVYCEMGTTGKCGGEGGWTKVAYYDISQGDECPYGLGKTVCDRKQEGSSGRCDGTFFSTLGVHYTKVCGRVHGYQHDGTGYVDGIYPNHKGKKDIDWWYVDGVSITRGSPREHIWTFVNGHLETGTSKNDCPCNEYSKETRTPSFVGDHYYCESATSKHKAHTIYPYDPLWDGQDCNGAEVPCCTNPNLPFFVRTLPTPSYDDIELRICSSGGLPDEACGIDMIELYVK